jgi:hypothetical protein
VAPDQVCEDPTRRRAEYRPSLNRSVPFHESATLPETQPRVNALTKDGRRWGAPRLFGFDAFKDFARCGAGQKDGLVGFPLFLGVRNCRFCRVLSVFETAKWHRLYQKLQLVVRLKWSEPTGPPERYYANPDRSRDIASGLVRRGGAGAKIGKTAKVVEAPPTAAQVLQ